MRERERERERSAVRTVRMCEDMEIPLPDGLEIWFGPYGKAELRANRA